MNSTRHNCPLGRCLLQVQEEMRNLDVEKAAAKGPVVTGTVHGPSGNDKDDRDDEPAKPEARAPQTQASAAPSGPPDAKLKDDDMRRLISQVPTDKAKPSHLKSIGMWFIRAVSSRKNFGLGCARR